MHKVSASSWQASINYGFKEDPDVPDALRQVAEAYPEIDLEPMRTSFYLSRQTVVAARRPAMARWRRALFAFMARNATRSTRFSRFRPTAWWKWACRWNCRRLSTHGERHLRERVPVPTGTGIPRALAAYFLSSLI